MNIKKLEKTMKGFANRRRLAILSFLQKNKEMSVGEIADKIHLSFRATSQHLRVLNLAELVEFRKENVTVFYRLSGGYRSLIKTILDIRD